MLKTFHKPPISLAIFEETEKIENLRSGPEAHEPAPLANGDGRYPDGNEPVRNRRRERASRRALRKMGFAVWTLWEHGLKVRRIARRNWR